MPTFLIKRSDVSRVLNMQSCIKYVETAFELVARHKVQMPPQSYMFFDAYNGDLRSMSAYIPDFLIAGIKAVNVHPDNDTRNLLSVMATVLLIDPSNGLPIALMDGSYITGMRTGAAGGVATKYLANKKIEMMGFVGAGQLARTLLDAIMIVHPEIKQIKLYDKKPKKSEIFKEYAESKYSLKAEVTEKLSDAVIDCGIVNTSTSARRALFDHTSVSPGTHINAMGADAEGKQEMCSSILKDAILVVDSWDEAGHSGEINVPVHMGEINREHVHAELGEIIIGEKNGRKTENDITVFDSTGLAIQDVMVAWHVYKDLTGNTDCRKSLSEVSFLD